MKNLIIIKINNNNNKEIQINNMIFNLYGDN